jgi:hypothetical protein
MRSPTSPPGNQHLTASPTREQKAGVIGNRIGHPIDDPDHLIIDLDFETSQHAEKFRQFLTNVVWSNREASPGLAGRPTTRVVERVSAA